MSELKRRTDTFLFKPETIAFITAFIVGTLSHMLPITNMILTEDGCRQVYYETFLLVGQGKWLMYLVCTFLRSSFNIGAFSSPLAIFIMALFAYYLAKIFPMKRKWLTFLVTCILITSPSIMSMFLYPGEDAFCLAALTYFIGSYILLQNKRSSFIWGTFIIWLGLCNYQAFVAFPVAILLVKCMLDMITGAEKYGKVIRNGFKYILCIVIAIIMYYISVKISFAVFNIEASSYRGIDEALSGFDLMGLIAAIPTSYRYVINYLLYDQMGMKTPRYYWLYRLLVSGGLISFIGLVIKHRLWKRLASLITSVVLLFLLPLTVNIVGVLSQNPNSHWIMMYPIIMLFIFPAVFFNELLPETAVDWRSTQGKARTRMVMKHFLPSAIAFSLLFTQFFNQYSIVTMGYTRALLAYDNARNLCFKMYCDVTSMEGYTPETKVVLIGTPSVPKDQLWNMNSYTGLFNESYICKNTWYYRTFMLCQMNLKLNFREDSFHNTLQMTDQMRTMPIYPSQGYVQMVDGDIYVRLGEEPN